jgi:hypothetical protein
VIRVDVVFECDIFPSPEELDFELGESSLVVDAPLGKEWPEK